MQVFKGTIKMWDDDTFLLVFPPEVMEAMGAEIGDEVVWSIEDGNVTVRRREQNGATGEKA